MQIIENEIRLKDSSIRQSGKGGLVVRYPAQIADSLGIKAGAKVEMFANNKGEIIIRPVLGDAVALV